MNLLDSIDFFIQLNGDKTGETWTGNFSSLRRLSHRQELMRDRVYRELIGPNPEGATERARSQAELFADLKVCLVKTPAWWKESDEGLSLCDDNLIQEIWQNTIKIRVDAIEEVQKKAVGAQDKLKKVVESNPDAKIVIEE